MRRVFGRELQRLILAITSLMMILSLAIIAFFIVEVSVTTHQNIEKNRDLMVSASVLMLQDLSDTISNISGNSTLFTNFRPEVIQTCLREPQAVYDLIVDLGGTLYPLEYIGISSNGQVLDSSCRDGSRVDASSVPIPSDGAYETFESLGDQQGYYIAVAQRVPLSAFGAGNDVILNMVVNRQAELNQIEAYFNDQRSSLMLILYIGGFVFIVLTLLLTTFGLRHFTSKYVMEPLENLNRTAEGIAEGTFEGEVEVDRGSAFAALQGLLQSGQKLIRKMDDLESREKDGD
jgi:nitrogen fixation/metabolism regulation signal transduction histidine kinase